MSQAPNDLTGCACYFPGVLFLTKLNVVKTYLDDRGIDYQLSAHSRTATSRQSPSAAHIKPHQLAKAVLMKQGGKYLMVVVSADSQVDTQSVDREMDGHYEVAPMNQAE